MTIGATLLPATQNTNEPNVHDFTTASTYAAQTEQFTFKNYYSSSVVFPAYPADMVLSRGRLQRTQCSIKPWVGVRTAEGELRVVDHLVQEGEDIYAVEVKTGNATRNASQLAKDTSIETKGGKLVGKNAPKELKGKTIKFKTIERKPQ